MVDELVFKQGLAALNSVPGVFAGVLEGAVVAFELRGAVDASSVIQCGTLDGRPRFAMVTRP